MPPRNEHIQLEYPSFNSSSNQPINPKKMILMVLTGLFIFMLIVGGSVFVTYQKKKSSENASEKVLGAAVSPTPSQAAAEPSPQGAAKATPSPTATKTATTPSPTTTSNTSNKPNIPASEKTKTYVYDYLGISIPYPENWKVEVKKQNFRGTGYKFDCKDKVTANMFLKTTSGCTNDMIEPENLVLTGPNNEQITFWNTLRTEATCPNNKEFKVVILGSLKTFTPVMKDDKVTPCYSIAFQPGKSSMWQLYRIDFIGTPVQYDYIHTILESIQYS